MAYAFHGIYSFIGIIFVHFLNKTIISVVFLCIYIYQLDSVRHPGEEVHHLIIRGGPGSYDLLGQFVHAPHNNNRPKHFTKLDGSPLAINLSERK